MSQFISIEWLIKRHNMYVNIDCYKTGSQGKVYFKPNCCNKLVAGCNIATCGCDPELSIRVQVLDNVNQVLAQQEFENPVQNIVIDKDALGHIVIQAR